MWQSVTLLTGTTPSGAMLLLSKGMHPKIVLVRMGHADNAMTLNIYSHVTPDMQR
jgi:integrase